MKTILLLTCVIPLFISAGCLVSESHGHGRYHGRGHIESHTEIIVPAPPTVIVRPPEIIVR